MPKKQVKAALLTKPVGPDPDFSGVVVERPASILADIALLVQTLRAQREEIARRTTELEDAVKVYDRLILTDIPDAMEQAQLSDMTLQDGAKLKIKDDLNTSIAVANRTEGYQWLRDNGLGAIIKSEFTVDLRATDKKHVRALLALCERREIESVTTESIHAATFKASVKDMLAKGVKLPSTISVHQFKKAELKEPKK